MAASKVLTASGDSVNATKGKDLFISSHGNSSIYWTATQTKTNYIFGT